MRYVILRHELPIGRERGSHWDVMFEQGDVLRTWAIEQSPDSAAEQTATPLADHRRAYLTYEGPVSGDRGSVTRWDEGTFEIRCDAGDVFEASVAGRRLWGIVRITQTAEGGRYEYAVLSTE